MTDRAAGFFGLAATACFTISLLVFADIYPGYSHATKAISELGAIGAPHQVGWNLLGFMLPGLLLAFHGWGVGQAGHDRIAAVLFSLAGLSFAATSIPVDMSSYHLPTSQAHITASLDVFVFWLMASLKLALRGGSTRLSRVTTISLWLAAAAGVVRFSGLVFPGTGQRLAFAAFFVWVLATSLVLVFSKK